MENNFSKGMREGGQNPTESYGDAIRPENRNSQDDQRNTGKDEQSANNRQNFDDEFESEQENKIGEEEARSEKMNRPGKQ